MNKSMSTYLAGLRQLTHNFIVSVSHEILEEIRDREDMVETYMLMMEETKQKLLGLTMETIEDIFSDGKRLSRIITSQLQRGPSRPEEQCYLAKVKLQGGGNQNQPAPLKDKHPLIRNMIEKYGSPSSSQIDPASPGRQSPTPIHCSELSHRCCHRDPGEHNPAIGSYKRQKLIGEDNKDVDSEFLRRNIKSSAFGKEKKNFEWQVTESPGPMYSPSKHFVSAKPKRS